MAKIVCPQCNAEIDDNCKFCPKCDYKFNNPVDNTVSPTYNYTPSTPNGKMKKPKKPIYKRFWFWLLIIIVVIVVISKVSSAINRNAEKNTEYIWPSTTITQELPEPVSTFGEIIYDSEDSFKLDVQKTSPEDYQNYVEECKAKGFTKDYSNTSDYYSAKNDKDHSLYISYNKDDEIMTVSVDTDTMDTVTETESTTKVTTTKKASTTKSSSSKVSPEFKKTMDSYEEFFDEYIEFMEEYANSDNPVKMMAEYTDFMQKYSDYLEKMDEIDEESLSDADSAYFLKVQNRINEKLLNSSIVTE